MTNRSTETFNHYLEMAISQGWGDPVGFANRRMDELEREAKKEEATSEQTQGNQAAFLARWL